MNICKEKGEETMIKAKEARELANGTKRFALIFAEELKKLDTTIRKNAERGENEVCLLYYTPNPLLQDFNVLINACEELGYDVHATCEKSYDGSLTSAILLLNW